MKSLVAGLLAVLILSPLAADAASRKSIWSGNGQNQKNDGQRNQKNDGQRNQKNRSRQASN